MRMCSKLTYERFYAITVQKFSVQKIERYIKQENENP